MAIIVLIVWLITGARGGALLLTWVGAGGMRPEEVAVSRLPRPALVTHATFALAGLGLWVAYIASNDKWLGWASAAMLPLIALAGAPMLLRWRRAFRAGRHHLASEGIEAAQRSPEASIPISAVVWHALAAILTIVCVIFALDVDPIRHRWF